MSGYSSAFPLYKITNSLGTVSQRTQEKLLAIFEDIQLDDSETKLAFKVRKRQLQEAIGSTNDISKLPVQYTRLEEKCDALEKICKRLYMVTKTFEVDGYDYPLNLTESLSDWWETNKNGFIDFIEGKTHVHETEPEMETDRLSSHSFPHALFKAARDSSCIIQKIKDRDQTQNDYDESIDEYDYDITALVTSLNSFSDCQHTIDQNKIKMDTLITKSFNAKLLNVINKDFKQAHSLRKIVEDSRLKFDTLKYELKLKDSLKPDVKSEIEPNKIKRDPQENRLFVLLEKLEDEFVINTENAVEYMTEVTDNSNIISLIKLFNNIQLSYYKESAHILEKNMEVLNKLDVKK